MKKDSIFCHSFIYKNAYQKDDNGYYWISSYGMHEVEEKKNNFLAWLDKSRIMSNDVEKTWQMYYNRVFYNDLDLNLNGRYGNERR